MIKRLKELAYNVLKECEFLQALAKILVLVYQFEVING